jgi:hypothetical protein
MFSGGNRGFDVMMPKPKDTEEEEFNHTITLNIFSKKITLSLKVNSKE